MEAKSEATASMGGIVLFQPPFHSLPAGFVISETGASTLGPCHHEQTATCNMEIHG